MISGGWGGYLQHFHVDGVKILDSSLVLVVIYLISATYYWWVFISVPVM